MGKNITYYCDICDRVYVQPEQYLVGIVKDEGKISRALLASAQKHICRSCLESINKVIDTVTP